MQPCCFLFALKIKKRHVCGLFVHAENVENGDEGKGVSQNSFSLVSKPEGLGTYDKDVPGGGSGMAESRSQRLLAGCHLAHSLYWFLPWTSKRKG
jgi:hypothetical protein